MAINRVSSDKDFSDCIKILSKYNTRENPREVEITSDQIFVEILEKLDMELYQKNILEYTFFDYFQQSNQLYDDTEKVLKQIKAFKFKATFRPT